MADPALHFRVRHAVRVACGAAVIHSLSVQLPIALGCLSPILFYISTIAGTPESFQGFQLISAALTFWGVIIAGVSFSIIIAIGGTSTIAIFLLTVPFVLFFVLFRTDRALLPCPIVAVLLTGFLVITKLGISRSEVPLAFLRVVMDGAIAYFAAVLVNVVLFPDRACDEGKSILAKHLSRLGAGLSAAGSRVFSDQSQVHVTHAAPPLDGNLEEMNFLWKSKATAKAGQKMFGTSDEMRFPPILDNMLKVRPFGYSQASNYAEVTRAEQLFSVSKCEPSFVMGNSLPWRHNDVWKDIISGIFSLTNIVSAIESSLISADNLRMNFSRELTLFIFGEAYLPLWSAHFASCAAACATMSYNLRYGPWEQFSRVNTVLDEDLSVLHKHIDPHQWKNRRADMYFGVFSRYRHKWCRLVEPSVHFSKDKGADVDERCSTYGPDATAPQALVSFAISSHAMAEEIGRLQKGMLNLAQARDETKIWTPFYFLYMPAPLIWKRISKVWNMSIRAWEVKFMMTNSLMLISLLALALFLPARQTWGKSETGWVFTSAVLSTQLTVEPTLFNGVIRVFATMLGAGLAFVGEAVLRAMGRSTTQELQYLIVPDLMIIVIAALLLFPVRFRYAAFLTIATASLVSFCPQTNSACNLASVDRLPVCFASGQLAGTRTASVSLGVICAFLFHVFFWPRFAQTEAMSVLGKSLINASRLFQEQHMLYFESGENSRENQGSSAPSRGYASEVRMYMNDHTRVYETVKNMDIYPTSETELSKRIVRDVDMPLKVALVLTKDASVLKNGPMKMNPLLPEICKDFVALSVSLHQMSSLLNRVPLFCGTYGRSAFNKYIAPCLYQYKTLQISLHSVVQSASRALTQYSRRNLENSRTDIVRAVNHLAEARNELVVALQIRASAAVRRNDSHWRTPWSDDSSIVNLRDGELRSSCTETGMSGASHTLLRRSVSFDDNILRSESKNPPCLLRPDDAVLFVSFRFAATSCINAFSRVVRHVMADLEKKL